MTINRHVYTRSRNSSKIWLIVGLVTIALVYIVEFHKPQSFVHVVVNISNAQRNLIFTRDKVYFLNGVAYDYYSIDEIDDRLGPNLQWKAFPLPDEQIPSNITAWRPPKYQKDSRTSIPINMSSQSMTGLVFIDKIYITTASKLIDRRNNLEKIFTRHKITNYEWRMKWGPDACNSSASKPEVYEKMNLPSRPIISAKKRRQCAITMEHVDIWHDMVSRNSSLSLILEDDAVFVANFPEKLNRTIYTAIRTGALKLGGLEACLKNKTGLSPTNNEWFEQNPVIVIGSCMHMYDRRFQKDRRDASPMLSTHKTGASRCTHAYLLTACSAQALIHQISVKKNIFLQSDLLLNKLVVASPTLQSFWLDPPIVYQGNRITDLDNIPSFKRTTY